MARPRRDGPTPAQVETDRDLAAQEPGWSDFITVETQRRELFSEEFPAGPYGAPRPERDGTEHRAGQRRQPRKR